MAINDSKNQNNSTEDFGLQTLLNGENPVSVGILNNASVNYAQI